MHRTWVLAAHASAACCFVRQPGTRELAWLAAFEDPQGRSKSSDLVSDRAGYEGTGRFAGGSAYSPRTEASARQHDEFARRLATYLNRGIAAHECDELVIVASNPFLGELKSHLSEQSAKALSMTVVKNVMQVDVGELAQRVEAALEAAKR